MPFFHRLSEPSAGVHANATRNAGGRERPDRAAETERERERERELDPDRSPYAFSPTYRTQTIPVSPQCTSSAYLSPPPPSTSCSRSRGTSPRNSLSVSRSHSPSPSSKPPRTPPTHLSPHLSAQAHPSHASHPSSPQASPTPTSPTRRKRASSSPGTILSDFNPTTTLHIPCHGFSARTSHIQVLDVTAPLRGRHPLNEPDLDQRAFREEVAALVEAATLASSSNSSPRSSRTSSDASRASTDERRGSDRGERQPDGRLSGSAFGMADADVTLALTIEKPRRGAYEIRLPRESTEVRASWRVPWSRRADVRVRLTSAFGRRSEVVVRTSKGQRSLKGVPGAVAGRSVEFTVDAKSGGGLAGAGMGGGVWGGCGWGGERTESYRWQFRAPGELVLEKRSPGTGRYVVALFYLKWKFGATGGTLLFDERGVSRVLAVASLMVMLKRERQRMVVMGWAGRGRD